VDNKDVSLEDVGNAEALLNRLVFERKTLESGVAVLKTYRMVKSQLQPAIEELSAVELAIAKAKQNLAGVESAKNAAMVKAEKDVETYRLKKINEAEKELATLTQSIDDLSAQYDKLVKEMGEAKEEYAQLHAQQSEEYLRVERELEEMKREHTGLAEAMNKAAAMFSAR